VGWSDKVDGILLTFPKRSYHSSHFALLSRALHQSIKIALMVESSGFLCVQIMMPVGDKVGLGEHQGILEFKVGCEVVVQ
jgi:cell cycle checkpoint protein